MNNNKKEQMFALVAQWRESGLTRTTFANQHGIGTSSFDYWCKKQYNEVLKPQSPVKSSFPISSVKSPSFVELTSGSKLPNIPVVRIEFELEGGICIKIY